MTTNGVEADQVSQGTFREKKMESEGTMSREARTMLEYSDRTNETTRGSPAQPFGPCRSKGGKQSTYERASEYGKRIGVKETYGLSPEAPYMENTGPARPSVLKRIQLGSL